MDRPLVLAEPVPGIGHNHASEPRGAVAPIKGRLESTYRNLVARFIDLELGCSRIPDTIYSEEDAGLVTDFIAQCQVHLRQAEAAHKVEKATFLEGGRTVDGFFKRRCESLSAGLVPVFARLKVYRDWREAEAAERHRTLLEAADKDAAQAAEYRVEAQRRALSKEPEDREQAMQYRALSDAMAESAAARIREAAAWLEPVRIQGDYGATAYVTHSWTFEIIDLEAVPRDYLALNAEIVRAAIAKDGVRDIPGLKIFQSESLRVRGAA
jgi:hypothetical protein